MPSVTDGWLERAALACPCGPATFSLQWVIESLQESMMEEANAIIVTRKITTLCCKDGNLFPVCELDLFFFSFYAAVANALFFLSLLLFSPCFCTVVTDGALITQVSHIHAIIFKLLLTCLKCLYEEIHNGVDDLRSEAIYTHTHTHTHAVD